ncbi:hypothetical protein PPL_02684 [Heterostelium album PN500]|uniref:Uncharacterized protein n=1 Tax=Heterostelium pallidum (strain ATCC 26659 / Pp 5 / PN500) TaxID=670386 RepID=D3B2S0_HETP5|nr:hypothetical protein PPL_02684 [Heterostelium album PN500]EFA83618.1 hypothetical protein PPL_02684 [Heterostelium album PN500]|eukprot:XP_020435735.1 hypothetical protein PPL_02684 [Heterostelium album PN500]
MGNSSSKRKSTKNNNNLPDNNKQVEKPVAISNEPAEQPPVTPVSTEPEINKENDQPVDESKPVGSTSPIENPPSIDTLPSQIENCEPKPVGEEEKPKEVVVEDAKPEESPIVEPNQPKLEEPEQPKLEEIEDEKPKIEEEPEQPKLEEIEEEKPKTEEEHPLPPIDEAENIAVERVRRPTRAEVELLNLFESEANKSDLPPDYKPKEINLEQYQQDLPKKSLSRKKSLRMKFYNTFSKKRSTKYENDLAAEENEPKSSSSNSKRKELNRTTSSIPNNFNSIDGTTENREDHDPVQKKKYLTLSGRMNTLRKIIFTPPEPKDKDIEELKERMREEEQKSVEEKPKKKSIFNSEDIARYGSYITKEVGHVFMFSGNCGSAYFF